MKKTEKGKLERILAISALVIALLFLANSLGMLDNLFDKGSSESPAKTASSSGILSDIIPTGIPAVYGSELKIKYDDVSASNPQFADATIRRLAVFDQQITLSGADMERYINVLYKLENGLSCEYCCGARSIIFENGEPACGCAHSFAMRGLTKYLITKHGSEYSDSELLGEIGKWKVLFFPEIHVQKAEILRQKGIETNYVNLASNKYRGIEQGASGGSMVGGC